MVETITSRYVIYVLMGIAAAVGVVSKSVASISLRRLMRASCNMGKSNHPLMQSGAGKI